MQVGDYILCFEFIRPADERTIVSSSTEVSITTPGDPDMRSYVRPGQERNRVAVTYNLQVLCSENYFGPTCSTQCTSANTASGDFLCSGEDGVVLLCQPTQDGGPDLTNCRGNGETVDRILQSEGQTMYTQNVNIVW